MANLVVFRDEDFCTLWVDRGLPDAITQFLTNPQNGFHKVDADGLREEMLAIVTREKENTVILFSQDIVPDTVLDDISASALIRRYLDCGGSIIWFGDVPCFYRGHKAQIREEIWKFGAPAAVLGVIPFVSCFSKGQNTLTKKAGEFGISGTWSGIRPVVKDSGITSLAEAEYLLARPYLPFPRPSGWRWWNNLLVKVGLKKIQISVASLEFVQRGDSAGSAASELWSEVTLANAWFKNYCPKRRATGFLRLWDTNNLDRIMNLEELLRIIKQFSSKIGE